MRWIVGLLAALGFADTSGAREPGAERPNVLFIAVDDLNHWVGYTGRNPQARTPNIDRLSASGVSFTNAHCVAPACEPSRAALFSGMRPGTTGCYKNGDDWREHIPKGIALNAAFNEAGYFVAAMGKTYHSSTSGLERVFAEEWDAYPPIPQGTGTGGAKKFEAYFEPLPLAMRDEDICDWHTINYCIEQMETPRDEPFFIACGLVKPHLPWAVPDRYYDLFPIETVQLPPHRVDDLDDVPTPGRLIGNRKDHPKMLERDRWDDAVRSYLGTIAYVDAQIGRLLDAYERSPERDNTILVLWGDHGWHLGEKQRWRKFTLWEEATRVPLVWVAPGVTTAGTISDRPVDLLSIYPTLCDLAGLPKPDHLEGPSLVPLLNDPEADWNGVAITTDGPGNHAVRDGRWRYIHYADGSEELYDHHSDPYEWTNLAVDSAFAEVKARLKAQMPNQPVRATRKP